MHTNRAMAILLAVTGNVDVKGGLLFNPSVHLANITKKERLGDVKAIWSMDYPLTVDGTGLVAEAILSEKPYPIKAMMVVGANPIQQYPNTNKVKKALEKLDLLVVIDLFMTETAEIADLVLPASTFFEKEEICHSIHLALTKFLQVSKRVIEPMYNTKPEWWMFCQLAQRLELKGFEFESEDEIIELLLEPMNLKRSD
jgi:anaerobic selenocysteine-containing dehydrogenase